MINQSYKICTRCVMDSSDPSISFNQQGECNLCTEFIEKRAKHNYHGFKSDEEFKKLIATMKLAGKGKKYDCVVGLSGGVDSSYVAYLCKKNGLRVLAAHMDNGWNSNEAVMKAAILSTQMREDCIAEGKSLIFETVFSANDKIDFVKKAKDKGYFIRLFFVGTESPTINASRIARRVMQGGHDVPISKIISRYSKSIANCCR